MRAPFQGALVALATIAAGALVTAGGVFAAAAFFDDGPRASAATPPATHRPATAIQVVTRGNLVDQESVDGKLTFADGRTIKSGSAGTITSLPAEGKVVTRGQPLFRIDRKPTILLYGKLPVYRPLADGVSKGPDVEQLERNLEKLGFGKGMKVDHRFNDDTARAVRRWQKHHGLKRTGGIDGGELVFLPEAARVSSTSVQVGDRVAPQRPVLQVTTTERLVRIDLDADKQDVARVGKKVTVKLAEGKSVKGTISKVAKVAKLVKSSGQDQGKAVVEVEIKVAAKDVGILDEAPVTVQLQRHRARNVLSVPVEALLALPQGGYGVEVVDARGGRRVPVTTGAFGNGRVEVSGPDLAEGMKVAVSGR